MTPEEITPSVIRTYLKSVPGDMVFHLVSPSNWLLAKFLQSEGYELANVGGDTYHLYGNSRSDVQDIPEWYSEYLEILWDEVNSADATEALALLDRRHPVLWDYLE